MKNKGFILIELIIVAAIVAILIAVFYTPDKTNSLQQFEKTNNDQTLDQFNSNNCP